MVTQHLLDELAAVLIRSKFQCWISVGDAVIVNGDDDLLTAGIEPSAITPAQLLARL